ncbi:hypothetical protein [Eilatimonas milleporae]|uniref:Uncharacterized protein n=1 Tax=Eilatimonas milleporae TaxID=911205 RepID=A0A3M0CHC5_9PROT|nr:hypothetical protein [Eilatimonas milleporae]RMB09021.1 hypothetical protein BXY39_1668 [Eilatimonas milleporae]
MLYTVQCSRAIYWHTTALVIAETHDKAFENALLAANASRDWKEGEVSGPVFIEAAYTGIIEDPWIGHPKSLHLPDAVTEEGEPPLVTIHLKNGVYQTAYVSSGKVNLAVIDDAKGLCNNIQSLSSNNNDLGREGGNEDRD